MQILFDLVTICRINHIQNPTTLLTNESHSIEWPTLQYVHLLYRCNGSLSNGTSMRVILKTPKRSLCNEFGKQCG